MSETETQAQGSGKSGISGLLTKAVIVICAIAVVACAARWAAENVPTAEEEAPMEEEAQVDAEQERIASMDADARDVEEVLIDGTWQTDDARTQVVFKDGAYQVTANLNQADPVPYEIGVVEQRSDTNNYRGETDVTYVFVLKTPAGESIAEAHQVQSVMGVDGAWKLTCEAILSGDELTNQPVTEIVEVQNMGDEVNEALGGADAAKKLKDELSDFCTRTFPTAKGVVFDQALTIDYLEDRAEARFTVDNRAQTKLLVYYNFADGSVNIAEG